MKEEVQRLQEEDRLEMDRIREQLRREEIEALDAKRRKRDETARELQEQIAEQEKFLAKRREQETALDEAFRRLNESEIERELSQQEDTTSIAKKEMAQYRAHLMELENERKKEEELLNQLLKEHQQEIERKKDEATCKLVRAKRELQKVILFYVMTIIVTVAISKIMNFSLYNLPCATIQLTSSKNIFL